MTSRFQHLELEGSRPSPIPGQAQTPQPKSRPAPEMETHDCAYWLRVADNNRRAGLFEEALRHYSRAVETDRAAVAGWAGQVRMLVMLEEYPEADLWARKSLELFRNQTDLTAARAQALCRIGELAQAMAACDAALQQPGMSYYPWLVRGDLMLARRDPVADHCFLKVTQLSGDWIALLEIAEIYQYHHQHARALARCEEAIKKAPEQAYCWYLRGVSQAATGFGDSARRSFQQCLQLQPDHARARQGLSAPSARGGWIRRMFRRS